MVGDTPLPANALSDEQQVTIPLPLARPLNHENAQTKSDDVRANGVATSTETQANGSPSLLAESIAFVQKLFHFGQVGSSPKLPQEADNRTAVYDITGRVVYLPNGEKMEAHSGLGKSLDNPLYVNEKSRGPTPPNLYYLTLRKSLFHGHQAIRLNPANGSSMHGRDGMLVHPYMLGPDGQSNGCVSLQDYPKFLEAFLRGDIDRLIVVSRLEEASFRTAGPRVGDDKQFASQ
jgi:hypothetical protein